MRTTALLYGGVTMTILMVSIICVITMKSSYYEIVYTNLDDSIEYAVKRLQKDRALADGVNSGGTAYQKNNVAFDTWDKQIAELEKKHAEAYGGTYGSGTDKVSIAEGSGETIDGVNIKELKDEQFKRDFVSYLVGSIDPKVVDLKVDIYGADAEYGLLSVKVTAKYKYPGKHGKNEDGSDKILYDEVSSYKTMIIDKNYKGDIY